MKLVIGLILILISPSCWAVDLTPVLDACDKSDIEICRSYQEAKKNAEQRAQYLIKVLNLETPMAVAAFAVDPKVNLKSGQHKLVITPKQALYTYEF